VDSCPALDANALAVRGCLQPGGSGIYPWAGGNGVIIASIRFHCEAGQLFLSYATPSDGERTVEVRDLNIYWNL
jgi:hypothetical protein